MPPAQKAVRAYNGTASVGDFLTISVDSIAQTITYKDYTNGETGTAPYTINAERLLHHHRPECESAVGL